MHPLTTWNNNGWLTWTNLAPPNFIYTCLYSHQSMVGKQHTWKPTLTTLLFSLFNMTCLIMQESVVLSNCCILDDIILWPQMSYYRGFSRNGLFWCKMSFLYAQRRYISMKKEFLEHIFSQPHTIWSSKKYSPMMMSSPYYIVRK